MRNLLSQKEKRRFTLLRQAKTSSNPWFRCSMLCLALIICLIGLNLASLKIADAATVSGPSTQGADIRDADIVQESLDEASPPWFDPEKNKIRTLSDFQTTFELQEGTQSDARGTAAVEFSKPLADFWDWVVEGWDWFWSQFPDLSFLAELHWLWWLLIILIAIGLAVLILYFLKLDALQRIPGFGQRKDVKKRKAATIEDLPFELEGESLTLDNLFGRARLEHQKGNLRLAMIYLFSHLLLKLDEKEMITLRKGKTNRVYAAEIRKTDRKTLPLYNSVMLTFEKCFFGHHPLQDDEVLKLMEETESWA